jgi:hypothetical protein
MKQSFALSPQTSVPVLSPQSCSLSPRFLDSVLGPVISALYHQACLRTKDEKRKYNI